MKNAKRTDESHLPYPLYTPDTIESTVIKAESIGNNTRTVISRLYENAKVKEQAVIDAKSVLDIASVYGNDILEEACRHALKDFYLISYDTLIPYVKKISKNSKSRSKEAENPEQKQGIVRGADYYRKDGTN